MDKDIPTLRRVRAAAARRILFLPHAARQMSRPDRMIRAFEVRRVIESGDVIEDYPDDLRGPSCLMLGLGRDDRPIHVVRAPRDEYLAVIIAYLPDPAAWEAGLRTRRRS
ncbi:MAG: DUF4258 domain-containing protein [Deferrisomatales bacterium]